jgi:hypothetical protein
MKEQTLKSEDDAENVAGGPVVVGQVVNAQKDGDDVGTQINRSNGNSFIVVSHNSR